MWNLMGDVKKTWNPTEDIYIDKCCQSLTIEEIDQCNTILQCIKLLSMNPFYYKVHMV